MPDFTRVIAWGDSLTRGRQAGAGNAYTDRLKDALGDGIRVVNKGINGDSAEGICQRFCAEPPIERDFCVIWAGTNNIVTTPERIIPSIREMTEKCAPEAFLVLSPLLSDRPNRWRGSVCHTSFLEINRQLIDSYGPQFLDIRTALLEANDGSPADVRDRDRGVTPSSLRIDQIHLNASGNAVVGAAVFRRLALLGLEHQRG